MRVGIEEDLGWGFPAHIKVTNAPKHGGGMQYLLYQNKTQEMCKEAKRIRLSSFYLILDHIKTQEICIKSVKEDPLDLFYVCDHFKTKEMCDKTVSEDPYLLQYVPDWFVKQENF